MAWSTPFEDPITLPRGRTLRTLQQAADYIMQLPEDIQRETHWQVAIEHLINAAEREAGWLMLARIGMLRALNADERRA